MTPPSPNTVHCGLWPATYTVAGRPRTINGYFGQVFVWHFGLSEAYYDGVLDGPVFRRRGSVENWIVTDYRYSASFMADPAYWNPATRTGPAQWRGQRATAVRFPALKALLADDRTMVYNADGVAALALCDGSARRIDLTDLLAPMPSGEGDYPGTWSTMGAPAIHTLDGVHGRDLP